MCWTYIDANGIARKTSAKLSRFSPGDLAASRSKNIHIERRLLKRERWRHAKELIRKRQFVQRSARRAD